MEYSLVLGGGGAKGSYELGVFKALKEMNINVTSVYGTSIGALNAAMIVQGDIEKSEKLWSEITAKDVMDIEENIDFLLQKGGISSTIEFMMHVISLRGLDITPFKRLLEEIIDEEYIRNSPIDFGIVTFSLDKLKPLKLHKTDIPKGKLIDYLIASAALPAFKKHTIDNEAFIDGGFGDNIPISLATSGNSNNIIVVDILSPGVVGKVDTTGYNIINIKNPFELRGSVLNFNRENIVFNMNLGYLDGKKAFGHLKGYRYYFHVDAKIHDYTEKYISSLKPSDILSFYKNFGVEINPKENLASKVILDSVVNALKRNSGENVLSKSGILLSSLEIAASFFDIEKVKVYTVDDFLKEIIKKFNEAILTISEDDYLEYMKNSVLLTNRKKIRGSLLEFRDKKTNLILYSFSCKENKATGAFKGIVSKVYPRLSIAANVLLYLDKEKIITLI